MIVSLQLPSSHRMEKNRPGHYISWSFKSKRNGRLGS